MMARPCVLVVDDDPDFQEFLAVLLTGEGYDVTTTDSVIGARVLARRLQPRAILLDLGLPYRTGGLLLGELKADPRTAHIPVIVVSGMPEALAGPRRALAAGIIRKPFEAQALLDALRRALQAGGGAFSSRTGGG